MPCPGEARGLPASSCPFLLGVLLGVLLGPLSSARGSGGARVASGGCQQCWAAPSSAAGAREQDFTVAHAQTGGCKSTLGGRKSTLQACTHAARLCLLGPGPGLKGPLGGFTALVGDLNPSCAATRCGRSNSRRTGSGELP